LECGSAQLPPYRLFHAELFIDKAAAALPHSKGFASEYIQLRLFMKFRAMTQTQFLFTTFDKESQVPF
jgi:hypothetical protein